jgi:hypothetical protein
MKHLTLFILLLAGLTCFAQNPNNTLIRFSNTGSIPPPLTGTVVVKQGVVYYTPDNSADTIYFSSEQPATLDQVSITFQTKTNQDTIWIDWGEDAPVWVSGTTDQTKTSDYSTGSTTYNIKIYGDIDKITKFSVNETYVTFGAMSNNIGKMTGLTYLYLRNCTGVATCTGADIPTGLTSWTWYNLPNLTATVNSADIPDGLTSWTWHTLPKLTATINSADIPDELTTWYWHTLPKLTATINSADIPIGLTYWYWYNLPNLTANGLSITALSKALTVLTMSTITLSTARVDELLASMDAFYAGANLMTQNATITLNGTGVGAPTGGASNTNIVSLISKATSQSKTWTFVINTP